MAPELWSRERCPRGTGRNPVVISLTLAQRALWESTGQDLHTRGTYMDNTNENLIESTKAGGSGKKRKIEEDDDDFINTVEIHRIKVEEKLDEDPIENDEDDYVAGFFGIKRKLDEIIRGLRENVESTDIRWRETGDLLRDCMDDIRDEVHELNTDIDEDLKEGKKCEDKMEVDKLIKVEMNRSLDEDKENKYLSCNNRIRSDAPSADSIKIKVEQEWNAGESDGIGKVFEECFEEQHSLANSLVQEFLDLLDNIKDEITDNEDNGSSVVGLRSHETSVGSTETLKNVGLEVAPQDIPQNEKTTDDSVERKDSSTVGLQSHKISKNTIGPEEVSKYSLPNEQTIDNSVEPKETSEDTTKHEKYERYHRSKKRKSEDLTSHKESKHSRKSDENSPKSLVGDKQSEYDKLKTESKRSTTESKKSNKRSYSSYESEIKSSKIPKTVSPTAESKQSPKDCNNERNVSKKRNDEPELTKIQKIFLSPIRNVVKGRTPTRMEEESATKIGAHENEIADVKPTAKDLSLSEICKAKTESNENDNRPALSTAQVVVSSPYPRNAIRQLREVAINRGLPDVLLPGYTYGEQTSNEFAKHHNFGENSFEDLEDNEMAWCFTNKPPSSSNSNNKLKTPDFATDTNVIPKTFVRPITSHSNNASATKATKPVDVQTIPKVSGKKKKKKKKKRSRNKNSQNEVIALNTQNQPSCSGYQPKKEKKISNKPSSAQARVIAQSEKKQIKTNTDGTLSSLAHQLLNTLTEINGGRRIAIVPSNYPQTRLTVSQGDLIIEEISKMLDQIPHGSEVPRFEYTRYFEGVLWVQCTDMYSTRWLVCVVPGVKPWPGASLRIWSSDDKNSSSSTKIPKLKQVDISIPGTPMTTADILQRLERQNRGLNTQLWVVYLRNDSDHYVTLTVGIDNTSHRQIKEMDYVAYVGLGRAFFKDVL